MQLLLTAAVSLLLASVYSVNGLKAVLNDTCGAMAFDINAVACMIKKLDVKLSRKLDEITQAIQSNQGKLCLQYGQNENQFLIF